LSIDLGFHPALTPEQITETISNLLKTLQPPVEDVSLMKMGSAAS
jgi:hypothetical protein